MIVFMMRIEIDIRGVRSLKRKEADSSEYY